LTIVKNPTKVLVGAVVDLLISAPLIDVLWEMNPLFGALMAGVGVVIFLVYVWQITK